MLDDSFLACQGNPLKIGIGESRRDSMMLEEPSQSDLFQSRKNSHFFDSRKGSMSFDVLNISRFDQDYQDNAFEHDQILGELDYEKPKRSSFFHLPNEAKKKEVVLEKDEKSKLIPEDHDEMAKSLNGNCIFYKVIENHVLIFRRRTRNL